MSSFSSSSSFSGLSSAHSARFAARTDGKETSRPRSSRASTSSYQATSSKSGSKVRRFDLGEGQCSPDRVGTPASSRNDPKPGHSPVQTSRNSYSRRLKVRSYTNESGSPCSSSNEARRSPKPVPDLRLQTARFQAHQHPHQLPSQVNPTRRLASGQHIQVALASPISLVFPLPPSPLSSPRTPPQRPRSLKHNTHAYLTPQGSHSSLTTSSTPLSLRSRIVASGVSTPSNTRQSRPSSLTTSPRPPTSLLVNQSRAQATLAMSIQIHAPSPIMSTGPTSPRINARRQSRSRSRPSSPSQLPPIRPPMARPPSRSERLLRDTLRKAEEHDRLMSLAALPSPSLFGATQPAHGFFSPAPTGGRRPRRDTSSSTGTDASLDAFGYCDTGACNSDEEEHDESDEQRWLWRSPSSSSSSSAHGHGHYYQSRPQPPRHHSDDYEKRQSSWRDGAKNEMEESAYGSPQSPSPVRTQLQRSARSASNASRSSVAQTPHHTKAGSRNSFDNDRSPHEAVLRSRLEGVLRGAQKHERRMSANGDISGGSNSLAGSRNRSGEGDSFFTIGESQSADLAVAGKRERTNTSATAPVNMYSYRSPPSSPRALRSPKSPGSLTHTHMQSKPLPNGINLLTPPPTPPFNAVNAAAQCRAMDGYVSFANIEGLGVPQGEEDEQRSEEAKEHGRWLKWLSLGVPKTGRERSEADVASR